MSAPWLADLTAPAAAVHSKMLVASFPEQNIDSMRTDDYFWLQDVTRRAPCAAQSIASPRQAV
jgi:hypothetical protein